VCQQRVEASTRQVPLVRIRRHLGTCRFEHRAVGRTHSDVVLRRDLHPLGEIAGVEDALQLVSQLVRVAAEIDRALAFAASSFVDLDEIVAVDGTLSEFVTVMSDLAYKVPDEISDNAAALLEPLSVGIWANRKAGTQIGASVLIAGAGPIGLVTTKVARAVGATRIAVTDVNRNRLEAASACGATEVAVPGSDRVDGEFDAFIDCSGSSAAIDAGIRSVRPAGSVVLVGMGADELTLPLAIIQRRELVVTGTFRYANTWPAAIALVASGRVTLDDLVTGEFGLADVEKALTAGRDPHSVKAVVRPAL